MDAVDIVVRAIDESGGVDLVLAFVASEALLMEGAALGNLLLSLENTALTPGEEKRTND